MQIVHSKNRKLIAPEDGTQAWEWDTRTLWVYARGRWEYLIGPPITGKMVRMELAANTVKAVKFPESFPEGSPEPVVMPLGWTKRADGSKGQSIEVHISNITNEGFDAIVYDEPCIFEFSYGLPYQT